MLDKFLPPTDNLYKFIAISGLLLIGFSFVPNYFNFLLAEKRIESITRTKPLSAVAQKLDRVTQNLKNESDKFVEKHNELGDAIRKYNDLENQKKIHLIQRLTRTY